MSISSLLLVFYSLEVKSKALKSELPSTVELHREGSQAGLEVASDQFITPPFLLHILFNKRSFYGSSF